MGHFSFFILKCQNGLAYLLKDKCMLLNRMNIKIVYRQLVITTCLILPLFGMSQHVALFTGGQLYDIIEEHASTVKLSGSNTIIFWSVHIYPDGDLVLNNAKIIEEGEYVGSGIWLSELGKFKEQPTSINRIEFSIASGTMK